MERGTLRHHDDEVIIADAIAKADHSETILGSLWLHRGIAGVIKLRSELEEAARGAFAVTDRANLFLKTSHSCLPGCRRELDHCIDQKSLQECLALPPEPGRGGRARR